MGSLELADADRRPRGAVGGRRGRDVSPVASYATGLLGCAEMATWRTRLVAIPVVALAACRAPAVSVPRPGPAPHVLITIVVDQMAAWMAETRWPQLPASGGVARLPRESLPAD